jgi:hypothetical protein
MEPAGRWTLAAALGLSTLGLVGCLHLPLMQRLFDLGALNRTGWGIALLSSLAATGGLKAALPLLLRADGTAAPR